MTVTYKNCIDACQACLVSCQHCLDKMATKESSNDCPRCCMQCIDACMLCIKMMAIKSAWARRYCTICAEICEWCATQCLMHDHDHCQACAIACKKCAQECRKVAA